MYFRDSILLVATLLCFVTTGSAQPRNYEIRNGLGVGGGVTLFDIISDNFETDRASGFMVMASITGDLPHKWYNIGYAIRLSENKINIMGRQINGTPENTPIKYSMFAAQAGIEFSIRVIKSNLTIDFGPQLQYNSDLKLENEPQAGYFINGYDNLMAEDIETLTQFNANGMVGVSAGMGPIKLRGQYIYGFTNILNELNKQNLDPGNVSKFKGNMSILAFTALFTF